MKGKGMNGSADVRMVMQFQWNGEQTNPARQHVQEKEKSLVKDGEDLIIEGPSLSDFGSAHCLLNNRKLLRAFVKGG